MLAVHFGAGNIGRGFIGSLLHQSGYEVCFVDVNQEIVDLLNQKQAYKIGYADDSKKEMTVTNIRAISSQTHPEQVVSAIAEADMVTTAVGPNVLPLIAGLIAKGLAKRVQISDKPLNIIACENMIGGSSLLKEKVYEQLNESEKEACENMIGFPDAAVDRIVPNQSHQDRLMVVVEPFYEWVVDRTGMVGKVRVQGMTLVDDLKPYIERKLYTVNTGHVVAAYLGYQAGFKTINEVMANPTIRDHVRNTLEETGQLLINKHDFQDQEHQKYIEKIIQRFSNPHISDEVTRVGRSPIRKLGPNDRLVSPARQYMKYVGKQPVYLAKAIAAALLYDFEQDPDAVTIQKNIRQDGLESTIQHYTQIPSDSDLMKLIIQQYHQFSL
ncbi:mannitol-1-phosphate 5-dehydrogenase [Thermoactinomyces mirandus]|uniref:Mannitol-1-phosphate 5-dehydrogenase n=1 Tax=Thermoactinomyces mirandus TaxID=2756294 RepID=A0A7W2ASN3_9BACL|nr:mannitol-1-phosphate 5-dehydrogenase [Thermoactinomyces mirandus]MBA4603803.1 mannitol-1-phosphate 5-dehydrogenase [Thermoactinomyces mirandus]